MHMIVFVFSFCGLNPSSSCLCAHENMVKKLPSYYLSMDASTNNYPSTARWLFRDRVSGC